MCVGCHHCLRFVGGPSWPLRLQRYSLNLKLRVTRSSATRLRLCFDLRSPQKLKIFRGPLLTFAGAKVQQKTDIHKKKMPNITFFLKRHKKSQPPPAFSHLFYRLSPHLFLASSFIILNSYFPHIAWSFFENHPRRSGHGLPSASTEGRSGAFFVLLSHKEIATLRIFLHYFENFSCIYWEFFVVLS